MAILTLPPFTPAHPWVRPSTPEAWQAEIQTLEKEGTTLIKVGGNPGLFSTCVGMGLTVGYMAGIVMDVQQGTIAPALCVAPFLLVVIALCFVFGHFDRKEARQLKTSLSHQRRLALAEVPPNFMRGPISGVPAAYVKLLSLEKGKVPLLLGDVADICQRHGIPMTDPMDGGTEWVLSLLTMVMLGGITVAVVGGLASMV